MKAMSLMCGLLALLACNDESTPQMTEGGETLDTLVLCVHDTIGVLVGDTLMEFGNITDVHFSGEGNIMLLDAMKSRISTFSAQGDCIETIGRNGSGPGEFQYPTSFTELSDGRLLVSDYSGGTVSFFDRNHEFCSIVNGFFPLPPLHPTPGIDGTYYARCLDYRQGEIGELPCGECFLGCFSDSSEPDFILVSHPLIISITEEGNARAQFPEMFWDSDNSGNIFCAACNDSTYAVIGMNSSGEEILHIEKNWERVEKTPEELEQSIYSEVLAKGYDGDATVHRNDSVDPHPYHNAINGLYVDEQNRIWVEQGYTAIPTFEVYSPEGGLEYFVTIPALEGVGQLRYCFKNGFLAYDVAPEDYPKVYLLGS